MVDVGSIRPSQLVMGFGPGSIINMEYDTVMVLGLQFWPVDGEEDTLFKKISHPYLSRQLEKSHFKMPVSDDHSAIPCISFPRWGVCQKCHILQKHPYTTNSKKGFLCKMGDSKLPLFHASFVQICDNGHVHEFPWDRWAHSSQGFGEKGEKGKKCSRKDGEESRLEYVTNKQGTGLVNYIVRCLRCRASRSMAGATSTKTFKLLGFKQCYGGQPWMGKNDSMKCSEDVYGVQVNSSSLYYSNTVTSLLIPDWIHEVDDAIDADGGRGYIIIRNDRKSGKTYEQILDWHKDGIFKDTLQKYPQETVIERLKMRFDDPERDMSTEGRALEHEFDNFAKITDKTVRGPPHDRKIDIEPVRIEASSLGDLYVEVLMKFHRLVSVHVMRGFTRGAPPDPYATEEQINQKRPFRPIGSASRINYSTGEQIPIDWLPALEAKGEGLFFKFDEDEIQRWEEREEVQRRFDVIRDSYADDISSKNRSDKQSVLDRFSSPRYILLHTFAHLLIREIAHHVGYSEASLRERIYSSGGKNPRNGILIYTSSPSSEGSLGGLVRLGDAGTFEEIIRNTVKRSNLCSRDPLCEETDPVALKEKGISSGMHLPGSSCYACTLLPETSCQNHNNLLDRWMIRDPKDGFFRNQLKSL